MSRIDLLRLFHSAIPTHMYDGGFVANFLGGFYRLSDRHASPPGGKKPPQKFATKRSIIHVCKQKQVKGFDPKLIALFQRFKPYQGVVVFVKSFTLLLGINPLDCKVNLI